MRRIGTILCLAWLLTLIGCASQRSLTITTEPSGAVVYINGPDETLRTPGKYDFEWYGDYDLVIRKEGYETIKTHRDLKQPWWAYPPFDLFADLFGAKDNREWDFVLAPQTGEKADAQALIQSAGELKAQLQSTKFTRKPATMPSTMPATRP
jgi:hypothetical protein